MSITCHHREELDIDITMRLVATFSIDLTVCQCHYEMDHINRNNKSV